MSEKKYYLITYYIINNGIKSIYYFVTGNHPFEWQFFFVGTRSLDNYKEITEEEYLNTLNNI